MSVNNLLYFMMATDCPSIAETNSMILYLEYFYYYSRAQKILFLSFLSKEYFLPCLIIIYSQKQFYTLFYKRFQ